MTEQQITTAAELDALPVSAIWRGNDAQVWEKYTHTQWDCLSEDGTGGLRTSAEVAACGPGMVLWPLPDAPAARDQAAPTEDREALAAQGGLTGTEFVITAWHIEDGRVVADEKVTADEYAARRQPTPTVTEMVGRVADELRDRRDHEPCCPCDHAGPEGCWDCTNTGHAHAPYGEAEIRRDLEPLLELVPTPTVSAEQVEAAEIAAHARIEEHWPGAFDGCEANDVECNQAEDCVADVVSAVLAALGVQP